MAQEYEVGYRKPPKTTQFKAGKSGNPKGRPRGSTNLATDLSAELSEQITVREGGQARRVTKQRAFDQVTDGASPPGRCAGNHRAAWPLCARHIGAVRSRDQPGRGRRIADLAPLRTAPRQRARQERSTKMKNDRDLADAIYRTDFGAFTYRAFAAINPGQRLIPNWHIDVIC